MNTIDTLRGRAALIVVTSAAMIEYGGMPLWVGVLMDHWGFDPKQAGALISTYLGGAVVSGFIAASLFGHLRSGRVMATLGLALAAMIFALIARSTQFNTLLMLHFCGGLCIGPVLAASQGTTGRSQNPHRLFAMTAVASSICAASFLAIMPAVVAEVDGSLFFNVVGVIFLAGAGAALFFFPAAGVKQRPADSPAKAKIGMPVWCGLFGLVSMALVYSMTMSFVERVGAHREYGLVLVSTVLTVMAVTKLFPAALAGLLENRIQVRQVLIGAPIVQALACTAIFAVPNVTVYSVAAPIFITTLLFAQVFAFGVISRLEPTGRATALSPSIMMVGSGVGPFLGGSLIKAFGYPALAVAGCLVALCAIGFFSRLLVYRSITAKTAPSATA